MFEWGGITVQEERIYLVAHHAGRDVRALGLDAVHARRARDQRQRAERTRGADARLVARPALRADVDGRRRARRARRGARRAAHGALGDRRSRSSSPSPGLGAALLGGFHSFPLTLLGGLIIGVGEAMATLYGGDITDFFHQDLITGLNRMPAFLVILIVVVVRGRGLPLRSHVAERLPKLGTGEISVRGVLLASAITLVLLFGVMDEAWAQATYISLAGGDHGPVDRRAHRVRRSDLARAVGARRHRRADRRPVRARRTCRSSWPSSSASCSRSRSGLVFAVPALRTPRREPRRGHARPRLPRVRGRVREPATTSAARSTAGPGSGG